MSPLQSARVALPAIAAASLTVAAAGTAAATDVGQQTRANASAGFQDTTQWSPSSSGASRSAQRASVVKAKADAQAKAKTRAQTAAKAKASRDSATRRAALGALAANDTTAESYTKPKPKPKPDPVETTAPQDQTAPTARGSEGAETSTETSTETYSPAPTQSQTSVSRNSARSSAPAAAPQQSSGGWVRPINGGTMTSGFGYRWGRMHSGIDYAAPVGTPLISMSSGTVTAVGWYGGQGKRVVVTFDNGTQAHYAHMSSFSVSPGQRVSAGQTIGLSGNTGNSTGPHLHLEIHVGGTPINPAGWLAARGIG